MTSFVSGSNDVQLTVPTRAAINISHKASVRVVTACRQRPQKDGHVYLWGEAGIGRHGYYLCCFYARKQTKPVDGDFCFRAPQLLGYSAPIKRSQLNMYCMYRGLQLLWYPLRSRLFSALSGVLRSYGQ